MFKYLLWTFHLGWKMLPQWLPHISGPWYPRSHSVFQTGGLYCCQHHTWWGRKRRRMPPWQSRCDTLQSIQRHGHRCPIHSVDEMLKIHFSPDQTSRWIDGIFKCRFCPIKVSQKVNEGYVSGKCIENKSTCIGDLTDHFWVAFIPTHSQILGAQPRGFNRRRLPAMTRRLLCSIPPPTSPTVSWMFWLCTCQAFSIHFQPLSFTKVK